MRTTTTSVIVTSSLPVTTTTQHQLMTSHARNLKRLMQWERFHARYPMSGKHVMAAGKERLHTAHVMAHARCVEQGRAYPMGIRTSPWMLQQRDHK
jgi:thioesterase domain-containing protein